MGGFGAEPVKFNRVPEKVPEKVWEALVQSQARSQQGSEEGSGGADHLKFAIAVSTPGRLWCRAKSSSTGFGREKFPEKVGEALVQSQVQQGSGEGLGGFGAEPGQV